MYVSTQKACVATATRGLVSQDYLYIYIYMLEVFKSVIDFANNSIVLVLSNALL